MSEQKAITFKIPQTFYDTLDECIRLAKNLRDGYHTAIEIVVNCGFTEEEAHKVARDYLKGKVPERTLYNWSEPKKKESLPNGRDRREKSSSKPITEQHSALTEVDEQKRAIIEDNLKKDTEIKSLKKALNEKAEFKTADKLSNVGSWEDLNRYVIDLRRTIAGRRVEWFIRIVEETS